MAGGFAAAQAVGRDDESRQIQNEAIKLGLFLSLAETLGGLIQASNVSDEVRALANTELKAVISGLSGVRSRLTKEVA